MAGVPGSATNPVAFSPTGTTGSFNSLLPLLLGTAYGNSDANCRKGSNRGLFQFSFMGQYLIQNMMADSNSEISPLLVLAFMSGRNNRCRRRNYRKYANADTYTKNAPY